jgi:hypothetical protein
MFTPLGPEMDGKICSSPVLYEAYGSLVLALRQIESRGQGQGIAAMLIRRTRDLGGKIQILLSPERQSFVAVDEAIDEPAWFNSDTGMIHWSKIDGCSGFDCLLDGRGESGLLVHEVAHVFLARALGSKHPREGLFHDARHVRDSGAFRDKAILSMRSKTTEASAFIEGLASAFETNGSFMTTHPFLDSNFIQMTDGCYRSRSSEYAVMFRQVPFAAPLDSEVYLASSLMRLLSTLVFEFDTSPHPKSPQGLGRVTAKFAAHSDRMKALLEAIIRYRPTSAIALGQALDAQMKSDFGRRWLREYYFVDIVTGQKIGPEFSPVSVSSWGTSVCTANSEIDKMSLSFRLHNEVVQNRKRALDLYSQRVGRDELVSDIQSVRSSIISDVGSLRNRSANGFSQVSSLLGYASHFAQNRSECLSDADLHHPRVVEIYDVLQRSGATQFLHDISLTLKCFGQRDRRDIYKELEDLRLLESRMEEIQKKVASFSESSNLADQVKSWLELKPQIMGKKGIVKNWIAVFEVQRAIRAIRP